MRSNQHNNTVDWMNRLTRTPKRRAPIWLAVSAALVGFTGCAQFGAANQQTPFATNSSNPAVPAASGQQTGPQPLAPTPTLDYQRPQASAPAVSQVGYTAPVSDPNRYTVRQYPNAPGAGGYSPLPSITDVPGALGDPYAPVAPYSIYEGPRERTADLELSGYPARTGRIMLGGAVNSDAGLTGQLTIDERNFDITRWPTSFQDLVSGTAFRGRGQTLRLEAAPGTSFQRYMLTFAEPSVLNRPISMSVSGFLYDRRYTDWDEQRLGGRVGLGYRITPDLSLSVAAGGQNVIIRNPAIPTPPELLEVLGNNGIYSGEVGLQHDTRNSPILASRGHYFNFNFSETFGDFDYSTFETEYRKYLTLAERADGSGKQTLSLSTRLGISGKDTPIFENYFAGGYATIRGFDFRGASPVDPTTLVELGGRFEWLNSVEYMFPITADDAFRGVAFVDFGTVEQNIEIPADTFRVAPGLGLRVAIPMLGPAPLAFDFAYPVAKADTDTTRVFSFYMSAVR